jgi:sterol desaturase/sphingolipid hydroxylase (fatty acid hydroxylase superfamily)
VPQDTAVTGQSIATAAVIIATFAVMLIAETFSPLRQTVESKLRRVVRNLTIGGIALAITPWLQALLLHPAAAWIARNRVGLLQNVQWPPWVETIVAIVLLDYTLWWWHWANHRVPFLWRFHLVHHADRDLDASTALRFHFGELALSVPVRALQMIIIGVEPHQLWLWQTIVFASILFHHSNLRLPAALEGVLVRVIVTPRMHGIHHSDRLSETDSNWSNLLSAWDYLHRTMRLDVPQAEITIGVPAYSESAAVTIGKMLLLPFRRQRRDWDYPTARTNASISRSTGS